MLIEAEFGTRSSKVTSRRACGPQSLFSSAELFGLIKHTLSIKNSLLVFLNCYRRSNRAVTTKLMQSSGTALHCASVPFSQQTVVLPSMLPLPVKAVQDTGQSTKTLSMQQSAWHF